MRVPLRPAALAGAAGAVMLAAAAAWITTRVTTERGLTEEVEEHLARAVRLGAERLRASQDLPLDSVAVELAVTTRYRTSVFDGDMKLVADPQLGAGAEVLGTGDGASRPEVEEALRDARAVAFSRRDGEVDGRRYVFGAARAYWRGETVVVRFGALAEPVEARAARAARNAALAVLVAGGAALLVLHRLLGGVVRSLNAVGGLLSGVGAGRPAGRRAPLSPVAELARTASAANRARTQLDVQSARAARERDELAGLVDRVAEGLMALTGDGRILRINPAAKELLGVTEVPRLAPVGSVVRDPVLRDLLEGSVGRPEGRIEIELGGRKLDVRTTRGSQGGAVAVLVDVTELRRLEEVRSDFVANASHELKTPLTVIRVAAETVLEEDVPPKLRRQFLRSIERNTVRLQRMVDDLLDLSRYESGAWRPQHAPVLVGDVAWSAWEEMEDEAAARGVKFRVSGEGVASGDEQAVYQVLRNLFENAMKHVPDKGGRIGVEIGEEGGRLRVAVRDNGAGIPASSLPRIFERFYRIDAARSRPGGGTGLGLAIVRHLVSSMEGEVSAESALGAGTTIEFALPLAEGEGGGGGREAGEDRKAGDGREAEGDREAREDRQVEEGGEGARALASGVARAAAKGASLAAAALLACTPAGAGDAGRMVAVGGSSSLGPLVEAVAEEFARRSPERRVAVSLSGSGGGFRRLCEGEIDVAGASRPISAVEAARCREAETGYLALPVARDGVTVVVNSGNHDVECLTLDELERVWAPSGRVATWRDLRPGLPAEKMRLYGPGSDSGTFDFFTTVVAGRTGASRADYYQTENDHLVARGVAGHRWALGYFGFAHYAANRRVLKAVAVDAGFGCVLPSRESLADGRYSPLARDLYIYVREAALARQAVREFASFFVAAGQGLAVEVGYAPLPAGEHDRSAALLERAVP